MKTRWLGVVGMVVGLALVPAAAIGGKGQLVDKDSDSGFPAVAVAHGTVSKPGKLTMVISTRPARKKVAWDYTTDCVKDGKSYEYPPPGSAEDKISRSMVKKRMKTVVKNPDECRFAASAKPEAEAPQGDVQGLQQAPGEAARRVPGPSDATAPPLTAQSGPPPGPRTFFAGPRAFF